MQGVESNDESYAIPDRPMLRDCRLEALDELLYLSKDGSGLLFVSEWLCNSEVVQEFFEN